MHGLFAEGINLSHGASYFDSNSNQEAGSIINYNVSSVGAGISFGLEKQVLRKIHCSNSTRFFNRKE